MAESKHLLIGNTNQTINEMIGKEHSEVSRFACHYNQSEEMFLKFDRTITVPVLPIHHDVRDPVAGRHYTEGIIQVVDEVMKSLPGFLNNLKYYFDPSDIHRPGFYQVYKINDVTYVYLLKFDLTFHPSHHRVITQGTNDLSPAFETNKLIVEADIIPISSIEKVDNFHALVIEKSISETWIGETGRGYFVQGIWLDRELTKFFSRLFLDKDKKLYPFYPLSCKYQSICQSLNVFSPKARKSRLSAHHNIRRFLLKYIDPIERALKNEEFTEDLEAFRLIKDKIPSELSSVWADTSVRVYLNEDDMREYLLEDRFI